MGWDTAILLAKAREIYRADDAATVGVVPPHGIASFLKSLGPQTVKELPDAELIWAVDAVFGSGPSDAHKTSKD